MGNDNSHVRYQEETARQRITAGAQVDIQRLHNERALHAEQHALNVKQAELSAQNKKELQDLQHRQNLERLANERKKQEDAHQMELKGHELETKKAENEHTIKMEKLVLEKEELKSQHELGIAAIEAKKDETKTVGEVLKQIINADVSEFAYKALISNSVIRKEAVDMKALDMVAEHHRMREEARLAITSGYSGGATHTSARSTREEVLKNVPPEQWEDEDADTEVA